MSITFGSTVADIICLTIIVLDSYGVDLLKVKIFYFDLCVYANWKSYSIFFSLGSYAVDTPMNYWGKGKGKLMSATVQLSITY